MQHYVPTATLAVHSHIFLKCVDLLIQINKFESTDTIDLSSLSGPIENRWNLLFMTFFVLHRTKCKGKAF